MASAPSAQSRSVRPLRLLVLLILVALGAAAIKLWPRRTPSVRVVRASLGTVRDVVSSSSAGEVTPAMHATLRAEIGGRVLSVRSRKGSLVKRGDLVVQLDPADLDARLRQAHAALDAAAAQRAQADARLETLKRQAQRAQLLAQAGAGTVQISEDARSAVREGEIALRAADGQAAQARAAQQAAQVQRSRCDLSAPFDGVLTEVTAHPGDSLVPGAPVFQIVDDNRLHVDAFVDEADAIRVQVGQRAELHLDALPGRTIAGRVSQVDPVVKRDIKGARSLTVEVEVSDLPAARSAGLLPGMSANVEILVAEKQNVLWVPSNVIIGRGVSRHVYHLEPQGSAYRVRRQLVDIGLTNWDRTEIRAGLPVSALMVTSLNEKGLEDGATVAAELPASDSAQPAAASGHARP
ncbi:MAG: efflux RND transporter periplasmic adaptor subunit [Myxococcales bacterium]|nr:efflux RND transporter periplasmic adaptor subunit [Myxococcales bacterium]